MGLFNFSSKKSQSYESKDFVWLNQQGKLACLTNLIQQNPDAAIIAWFEQTQETFQKFLNQQNLNTEILLARTVSHATNKVLIFLEHYPLATKESNLIQSINPAKVFFLSALDEPLLMHFGGGKIVDVMKNLGMKEDETIEHPMISKAIENLQEKLEKELTIENSANSQEEWLERNYKK